MDEQPNLIPVGDYIQVRVELREGGYHFLLNALEIWHARHAGLLDVGFASLATPHVGEAWAQVAPDISPVALDELLLVFEPFFTPAPIPWTYVPRSVLPPPPAL